MQEETTKVRAEQIEGLKELISQVIAEEGERLIPRGFLMDVEEIKRSPVGAVIRMEKDIKYLREGQEALRTEMGKLATREELEALQRGQEALRTELKKDLSNLEKVMNTRFEGLEGRFEARFEGLEVRLDQFEKRLSRTDFWIKFFAGLVSALFIAQLVLTYIK